MNRGALPALTLVALAACGSDPCGQESTSDEAVAPRIKDIEVLTQPVPGDPWEIVLVADFRDSDGDLAQGTALVFLNGKQSLKLALFEFFRQSALALDATLGQVTLPLRFGDTVQDDADVKVGLMLQDNSQKNSNCYSVDLNFAVRSL